MRKEELDEDGTPLFNTRFNSLLCDLHRQYVEWTSGEEQTRWVNVLDTYQQSTSIRNLALDFFQRHLLTDERSPFPRSFINFTLRVARYEQKRTGEPGKNEINYPNDLWKNICRGLTEDTSFVQTLNDYFAAPDYLQSDPEMFRVFNCVALDTALLRMGLLSRGPEEKHPYEENDPNSINTYYQLTRDHIGEIAGYLQDKLTWAEIFQHQQETGWSIFRFFLYGEDTYRLTYPDRYSGVIRRIFDQLAKVNLLPRERHRLWLVGAGEAPELPPLVEFLGKDSIDNVLVTDLYAPTHPLAIVKNLNDGENQGLPDRMIMDTSHYLRQHGFSPYLQGVDICNDKTIPAAIDDIDISTMFGVLIHIDGPTDQDKLNHKRAIENWVRKGRGRAIFIALWLTKQHVPNSGMVLQKVLPGENIGIEAMRRHPFLSIVFGRQFTDGSPVWSDDELMDLGVRIIMPDNSDWIKGLIDDRARKAVL